MASEETIAPFGQRKRDWTTLYRIAVLVLTLFCAGGVGVYLYAGARYVSETAQSVVTDAIHPLQDLPPRIKRLEERSNEIADLMKEVASWRRSKDEVDVRLTIILENQQKQLDRQQLLIDQLARSK